MTITKKLSVGLLLMISVLVSACNKPEMHTISFSKDIKPILEAHCLECHAKGGVGQVKSGLSMETHAELIKGTKFGAVIKAGDSLSSTLVLLIEGKADPSINMPKGHKKPLSAEQINTIKSWIDQGALNN